MNAPPALGRYRIVRRIADGGYGSVFEGLAPDGRRVAVKLLRVKEQDALARFERERRLLASLGEADGFVPLLDAGDAPEGPWLVMPLVAGGTLRERLAAGGGRLEPGAALALGRELTRAVARAHELGIVHRDLKPENVLFAQRGADFTPKDRPLVADLGLAKHFGAVGIPATTAVTRGDSIVGTLGYMAPEQVEDARSAAAPADVFALGAILFECLAGRLPFDAGGVLSFVKSVNAGPAPSLRSLGVPIPRGVDAAIQRALDPDPRRRFADAVAFRRALELGSARGAPRGVLAALLLGAAGVAVLLAVLGARGRVPAAPPPGPAAPPAVPPPPRPPSPARPRPPTIEDAAAALDAKPPRHEEALAIAAALLAKNPRDARAHTVRARCHSALGARQDAIADLEAAIDIEPTAERWDLLGGALTDAAGNDERIAAQAVQSYDRAIELAPANGDHWFHRAWTRGALLRDWKGAVADFTESIARGENAHNVAHRGWAHFWSWQPDAARADYDRALVLDPRHTLALRWRSELLENTGDVAGAIADIEQIIALETPEGGQRKLVEPRLPGLRARLGR